jgi:CRP-like cAMP-binding protein
MLDVPLGIGELAELVGAERRYVMRRLHDVGVVAARENGIVLDPKLYDSQPRLRVVPASPRGTGYRRPTLRDERHVRDAIRSTLLVNGARFGFTEEAANCFAREAMMSQWTPDERIDTGSNGLISFLASGSVKVVTMGRRERPVIIQAVRAGRFFGSAWFFDSRDAPGAGCYACTPAIVGTLDVHGMAKVLSLLPPGGVVQFLDYSWRVLSRLLYEKSILLAMPPTERVERAMMLLAREFGTSAEHVDVPLTRSDLCAFTMAGRGAIARELGRASRSDLGRQIRFRPAVIASA